MLKTEGCVLGRMPRSSLSGPCLQEANKGNSKNNLVLLKRQIKKTSPAEIYRRLPGWAVNT